MSEILTQQAVTALKEASTQTGGGELRQVSAQEQTSFADRLHQPSGEMPNAPEAATAVPGIEGGPKSPGDSILDSMSRQMSETRAGVEGQLDNVSGEMGDLMRLQYDIARMTMDQTLVGQVGSKGSQGIQQLLKGQ